MRWLINKKTLKLLILFLPLNLFGTKYAGDFTELGVGARICAMGKTGIAQGKDPSVLTLNPAATVLLNRSLILMHAENWDGQVDNEFGALVIPKENSAFGLGIQAVLVNDIKLTTLPDTTLPPGVENPPFSNDTVSTKDVIVYFNGARKRGIFFYGLNLKIYYRDLSVIKGIGGGIDLGAGINLKNLNLGIAIQDFVLSPIIWDTKTREYILPKFSFGIAPEIPLTRVHSNLIIEADLVKKLDLNGFDINIGVEYNYKEFISGRLGATGGKYSLGIGLVYRKFRLDYALLIHSSLGPSNKFSAGLNF